MRILNQSAQMKPQCLPQISQIYADKTQNNKTALISPICLSLRNNAACCIRLRHLRYLRENNTEEDSINIPRRNPNVSLADPADNRRQTTRTAKSQSVFLCEIMQLAAFLCVICVICGRIFTQEYSNNCTD